VCVSFVSAPFYVILHEMLEYSNRQNPRDPSFWRLCDTQTNECHCDFRMTITDCIESEALRIVNIVDIAWSGVATIIGRTRLSSSPKIGWAN
jgi:hypothetical protein